jgi:hypothetical protein
MTPRIAVCRSIGKGLRSIWKAAAYFKITFGVGVIKLIKRWNRLWISSTSPIQGFLSYLCLALRAKGARQNMRCSQAPRNRNGRLGDSIIGY